MIPITEGRGKSPGQLCHQLKCDGVKSHSFSAPHRQPQGQGMSSGKLQGFKQDEAFCTALIKCTTKWTQIFLLFQLVLPQPRWEQRHRIFHPSGTARQAWERLGKGNQ